MILQTELLICSAGLCPHFRERLAKTNLMQFFPHLFHIPFKKLSPFRPNLRPKEEMEGRCSDHISFKIFHTTTFIAVFYKQISTYIIHKFSATTGTLNQALTPLLKMPSKDEPNAVHLTSLSLIVEKVGILAYFEISWCYGRGKVVAKGGGEESMKCRPYNHLL